MTQTGKHVNEAAYPEAAFVILQQAGYLLLSGQDRLAFLQRQTTNDVRLLSPGKAVLTVLTSPVARILDVLYLLDEGEAIGVVSLPGYGRSTTKFLQNRIFFMDKVSIIDVSEDFSQIDVEGSSGGNLLTQSGISNLPQISEVVSSELFNVPLRVLGLKGLRDRAYRLIAGNEDEPRLVRGLEEAGFYHLQPEIYDVLRVEAGLPGVGHELTDAYIPLEVNLDEAISSNKGCYTGQEIIARQVTYDKVARHLVGLRLEEAVHPGVVIYTEDKRVGEVTSAVVSPRFGPIALGVIRRPHHQAGTAVVIQDEGMEIRAVVSNLPFEIK